jgi:hypothetical protein
LIEAHVTEGRLSELERRVGSQLVGALRREPGFCGAISLVERERADALLVVLWETEEEAARPLEVVDAPLAQTLATVTRVSPCDYPCSTSIWEVNARG